MKEYKNVKNLTLKERGELAKKLECWLGCYTQEIINKVMAKINDIYNNDMVMNLINELYIRVQKEQKEEINSFELLLSDFNAFKEFDIHNHCLTHSKSYRDILYDMYIR